MIEVNLGGRRVTLLAYYPCCETMEPPCSMTWQGMGPDSFLVGPATAEPPFPIWRRASDRIPAAVRLLTRVGITPCTRIPNDPHEWWDWEWRR